VAEAHVVVPTLLKLVKAVLLQYGCMVQKQAQSVGRFCQLDSTRFTIYHIFYFLTKIFCFQSAQSIPTMVLVKLFFFNIIISVNLNTISQLIRSLNLTKLNGIYDQFFTKANANESN